jgi:GGDEF domain-containing protein
LPSVAFRLLRNPFVNSDGCSLRFKQRRFSPSFVCRCLQKRFSGQHEAITLSMGVAQTGPDTFCDHDELIKRADKAMYQVKKTEGFQIEKQQKP